MVSPLCSYAMVGDGRCEHADIFTDPVIFLV